ncbi:hypothetical protein [Planctomycetes bacterium TBK1r]|uniref:Uncharacterized protein n=1 Tax=Stieleria magnilauensis TaxID=2527963 RepID=A0ABX5XVU2_9BACT|nr:hypothetical protein TBK1r_48580 [Planctomycetes bacterium TBK1r]
MLVLGGLAFVAMLKKFRENRKFSIALLVGSVIVFALMARVGNLGGRIQHEEIKGLEQEAQRAGANPKTK